MLGFGIQLLIVLIIVGGSVAFVGNYIGRSIGKKRLTIFNLRPRHTATLFTILSGVIIVFITVLVLIAFSQDTRTAIFGLESLKSDLNKKTKELQLTQYDLAEKSNERNQIIEELNQIKIDKVKLNKEISLFQKELTSTQKSVDKLKSLSSNLQNEITKTRLGTVLFKVNDEISISLIKPTDNPEIKIKDLLNSADEYLRKSGLKSDDQLILIDQTEFDKALTYLKSRTADTIIILIANRNVVMGEPIPASIKFADNNLLYQKNTQITSNIINGNISQAEIEQSLKDLLDTAHKLAAKKGILINPSGSVGSIPYSDIHQAAQTIRLYSRKVNVAIKTVKDIYRIGPLNITFDLIYR